MDSTNFDNFNSPAGGVELSDTLSGWRKKTNGIVMKIDSLETKVNTSNVTNNSLALGKIAQIGSLKVLGNTTGSTANVSEISVLDQDTLSSNSATSLATQQSIKAYVDALFDEYSLKAPSSATGTMPALGSSGWTDIDLSAKVGSNKALVIMSLERQAGEESKHVHFKTKGESFNPYTGSAGPAGSAGAAVGSGIGVHIVIMTDANGKIEGRTNSGTADLIDYKILAFQKQRV
tara:strand:- start:1480 stop:2178 length:699 start_codon:yes stop_codon:yes gene_type:complete